MLERRRYRKISIRVWGDERFRQLSKPKPNAQTLWFYLLTGPHTSAVPGLFLSGEASLAEALEWPLPAFRRCFSELTAQTMALSDWEHRVVWLPKSVGHNAPESPNVVKSWATALDEIPECHLKRVAAQALRDFIEGMGEGFREALRKGWPPALIVTPINQNSTETETEQIQTSEPAPAALDGFEVFWSVYPKRKARGDAEKAWRSIRPRPAIEVIVDAVRVQAQSHDWRKEGGKYVPFPATWIRARRWEDEASPAERPRALGPAYDADWFEECKRIHNGECELDRHRHLMRTQREGAA